MVYLYNIDTFVYTVYLTCIYHRRIKAKIAIKNKKRILQKTNENKIKKDALYCKQHTTV